MRLSSVLPYSVVMLSLEIERQWDTPVVSIQRSMRANSPSMRGRYRWMLYVLVPTVLGGRTSLTHCVPCRTRVGTRSSAPDRMKTSESALSRYWGRPLSVLRVIEGRERLQPNPNGPLPAPESYDSESCGPKPERPGLVAIGTDMEPVPVTGLAANFSPIPRMAPPPLGREMVGAEIWFVAEAESVPLPFGPLSSATDASTKDLLRGRQTDLIGHGCQRLLTRITRD